MPNIKDVARLAGVSVATVSRVINHDSKVSDASREKVLLAIQEIGYKPNLLGRNLRLSQTMKILVLVPTLSNLFYSRMVKGIESRARAQGYSIMICIAADAAAENRYFEMLYTHQVDGIILCSSEQTADKLRQIAQTQPLIMCGEYVEGAGLSAVTIDNRRAAYDAVRQLISMGHREIALLGNDRYLSARLREEGYRQALAEENIPIRPEWIQYDNYSFASGQRMCEALLNGGRRPTAVFAIADSIAIGAIRALSQRGILPGRDISVFGFDDTAISAAFVPSISTVAQPRFEIGAKAFDLLYEKMEDLTSPARLVLLEHTLVLRESTCAYPPNPDSSAV